MSSKANSSLNISRGLARLHRAMDAAHPPAALDIEARRHAELVALLASINDRLGQLLVLQVDAQHKVGGVLRNRRAA